LALRGNTEAEAVYRNTATLSAQEVHVFQNGQMVSIGELVDQAAKHGWNSMIYEAWCWEFRNQIHRLARKLSPLHQQALFFAAQSVGDMDISGADVSEAIDEARLALEGDPYDDLEDDEDYEDYE